LLYSFSFHFVLHLLFLEVCACVLANKFDLI